MLQTKRLNALVISSDQIKSQVEYYLEGFGYNALLYWQDGDFWSAIVGQHRSLCYSTNIAKWIVNKALKEKASLVALPQEVTYGFRLLLVGALFSLKKDFEEKGVNSMCIVLYSHSQSGFSLHGLHCDRAIVW